MLSSRAFLNSAGSQSHLVLIVLNYTLPRSTPAFWKKANHRICADGGANRIFDAACKWLPNEEVALARKAFTPDIIMGDLDSIRPEVADYYTQQGIKVTDLSHDQDSTDLHKCLVCAESHLAEQSILPSEATILAIGAFGGRIDHTLSNLNTLYTHQHLRLVLCGEGSLARLIPKGHTRIQPDLSLEGPECGVLALGAPATASSSGLKWNLDEHELAIGGLMSTSNEIVADEIVLDSTEALLWTTQFKDDFRYLE